MGKPADENLPEVATNPTWSYPGPQTTTPTTFDATPEVVSPYDAATHTHFTERDKYPVHFDDAPKLTYEPNDHQYNGQAMSGMPWETLPPTDEASHGDASTGVNEQDNRICGLRRRKLIIIAVVLVIIIVAASVGGVVATRARSGSDPSTAAVTEGIASSIGATIAPPASTASQSRSSPTSTITSSLPTQTVEFLNNQTGVSGLAFQGFEEQHYLGESTNIIRQEGYHDLPFNCLSYVWLPNGTDCCVTFCANKTTAVGWRCDPRYREKTESGTGFPRIHVWCGRADSNKYKNKCS
ncbi:hypothetical protein V8F33_011979 [Rhypophila sp. PSN 637]